MLLIFIIVSNNAYGQQNNSVEIAIGKKIRNVIRENIILDNIKDSTAVYFFLIKINIKPKKVSHGYIATVDLNNKSVSDFFAGIDKLKQFDYSKAIKDKKGLDIFIRSEILVYGSKDNNTIKLENIEDSLKYLYVSKLDPFYELFGIRLVIDKKVYQ
ncbi:MAG: hypothetical protein EOO91_06825 [Pedobacter sp.]|nr:MAG: hypothetical protein EOO91_06825 [Pedobacter sp.]